MVALWSVALALLGGCGAKSDFCDRAGAVREQCDGSPPSSDEQSQCEDSLKDCSQADLDLLDQYVGCLEGLDCSTEDVGYYDCVAMLADLEDPACGS